MKTSGKREFGSREFKAFPAAQEMQIQSTARIRSVNFQLGFTLTVSGKKMHERKHTQWLIENVNHGVFNLRDP